MRLSRILLASLCALSLVLTGCGKHSSSSNGSAQIQVINVVPEATALNFNVDTVSLASGVAFQGLTPFAGVDNGSHIITVAVPGSATNLINNTYSLAGDQSYTFVAFGPLTAVGSILAADSFSDPGNGFFALRVINAAAGAGTVDVYITPPGADLTTTSPNVGNVPYGATSSFASIAIGTNFEIRVTPAGNKEVIYDSLPKTFAEHSATNLIVLSKGSGKLVNVALLNIDSTGSGSIADNLLAQYKVINASLVPSALNLFVDGNLQLSNIPFKGVSNYQKTAAGPHNMRVEATATPGATLLALAPTLVAATDTSIAFTGTAGALNAVVLNDDNLPPSSGRTRVRFVNTSADVPSFDVFVNFSKQVSGLAANSASSYLEFDADATTGTAFEFDFNLGGTTTAALKLPGTVLTAGRTYTIYVVGPATALQGVLTNDD